MGLTVMWRVNKGGEVNLVQDPFLIFVYGEVVTSRYFHGKAVSSTYYIGGCCCCDIGGCCCCDMPVLSVCRQSELNLLSSVLKKPATFQRCLAKRCYRQLLPPNSEPPTSFCAGLLSNSRGGWSTACITSAHGVLVLYRGHSVLWPRVYRVTK